MIGDMLKPSHILMKNNEKDWKTAIRTVSEPLLEEGSITEGYVDAMIQGVIDVGPYIVIAPNIAFAHARPQQGANRTDLSLLILEEPVQFSDNPEHDCRLVFSFAAKDQSSHIEMLMQLSEFLSDENNTNFLMKAFTLEEVHEYILSWEGKK